MSPDEFGVWAAEQLEKKILEVGEENVAAFIAEPIQGAGGVIVPPDTYWPKIREILAKYDILFIADEVICGFGRTGEWFGSQYYGNAPDLMPIAKGLTSGYIPMGGWWCATRSSKCSTRAASSTTASPIPVTRWRPPWPWRTSASCAKRRSSRR